MCVTFVPLVMAFLVGGGGDETQAAPPRKSEEAMVLAGNDADVVDTSRAFRVAHVLSTAGDAGPETEEDVAEPDEAAEAPDAKNTGDKVIYLTFDDGPTVPYTKRVLDLLDEYDAKATFFQTGENATEHPHLTRAVVADGHVLGSHTWNHRDLRRLSRARVNRQITRTSAVLSRISGQPITCLRPPYGALNARVRSAIRKNDLDMKLWDVDPRDWKRPGAAAIAKRVIARADPGDVSLMHDGGGNRTQSVKALRRILRSLSDRGYRFETLPGC